MAGGTEALAPGALARGAKGRREKADLLPPGAPELLRPVVETGLGTKVVAGFLLAVVAWGVYAYITQLRNGLGMTGMGPYYSWGLYIIDFVFIIGVSHAGTLISAILRVSGADWRRPITRMAEVITGVALLTGAPMVIIDLGRPDRMLNLFIFGRLQSPLLWDLLSVTTYLAGSLFYLYIPMIPDLARAYPYLKDRYPVRARIYKALSLGWKGNAEQERLLERAISIMAVIIIPVAISVHTVISFIFAMTLREGWHSSIFGPYFVIGAIYSGIAAIITAMAVFRKLYHLEKYIKYEHFQKLGYLLLTAGLVYLYTTFAEYLTMGYGRDEAEQRLVHALFSGDYSGIFWATILVTFVPVLLIALARWTKMTGYVVGSVMVNIGMWLKRYIIITPTLGNPYLPIQHVAANYAIYHPTWVEISISAAAFSVFALLYLGFTKLFPIVSIWETDDLVEGEVS
ncbi:MAG: NrfD/PsrC family molybdoenzyme membrane anchor subunit [Symbiobacteriia bacterium]